MLGKTIVVNSDQIVHIQTDSLTTKNIIYTTTASIEVAESLEEIYKILQVRDPNKKSHSASELAKILP